MQRPIEDPASRKREAKRKAWTVQLYHEYEAIVFHFGLPSMTAVLKVAPMALCGSYEAMTRTITLGAWVIEQHPWDTVVEILKHEMAHQLADLYEPEALPHGAAFGRACRRLCVAPWAARCQGALPAAALADHIPAHVSDSPKERLLQKVDKLLSLAQSANEHEAQLAMQRARELCAKHHIETLRVGLAFDALTHTVVHRRRRRSCKVEALIVHILVTHFAVRALFTRTFDAETLQTFCAVELVGQVHQVRIAAHVFHFLHDTVARSSKDYASRCRAQKEVADVPAYKVGLCLGVARTLEKQKEALEKSGPLAAPDAPALIKVANAQTARYLRARHPKVQTRRNRGGRYCASSLAKGKADGERIVIHKSIARGSSQGVVGLLRS